MGNISSTRFFRRGDISRLMPSLLQTTGTLNQSTLTPSTALTTERVTESIRSTTSVTVKDRIIDKSVIPYMRRRVVDFSASGLRPGITVVGRFAGQLVSLSNDVVQTDGTISGTFTIPEGVSTGTKQFELYDLEGTTGASTTYTAAGQLHTKQKTITSVRNVTRTRQTIVTQPAPVEPVPTIIRNVRRNAWRDPIAQSFLIEQESGAFITKIGIYFKTKDTNLPVSLYIVPVENGMPTETIIPFSEVSVPALSVNTSTDASAETEFVFSDPVYLEGGEEYAFVLMSNSDKYEAWISTLGEVDIASNIGIARNPYLGSLFKSQNSTTWTPDQFSDLKFNIYRAKFNSASAGSFTIESTTRGQNLNATSVDFQLSSLQLPETSISSVWNHTQNSAGAQAFKPFTTIPFTSAWTINGSSNRLSVTSTLNSDNDFISPVFDKDRLSAFIKLNTVQDIGASEYNAGTYISQTVNLVNTSDDIKLLVEAKLPTGTRLVPYVKTNQYVPVYQQTGQNGGATSLSGNDKTLDDLIGRTVTIYNRNSVGGATTRLGQCIITGYDGQKIYFKSPTNIDIFSTSTATIELLASEDDTWDGLTILPFAGPTAYSKFDVVISNGKYWEAQATDTGTNLGTPSSVNANWLQIRTMSMGGLTSATYEAEAVNWQPLELENYDSLDLDSSEDFIEYMYKPKHLINSDFDSFSIKIDLICQSADTVPIIRSVRAIAVY